MTNKDIGYSYKELKLRDREWQCKTCNTILDRDFNASINILLEGQKNIGVANADYALLNP